jgi:hypothetical protein
MATLKELQDQAKVKGIKNVKKYKKAELEEMLAPSPVFGANDLVRLADLGALDVPDFIESLRNMDKGVARKIRKAMFDAGHRRLAGIRVN